jgi:hypothetical protein
MKNEVSIIGHIHNIVRNERNYEEYIFDISIGIRSMHIPTLKYEYIPCRTSASSCYAIKKVRDNDVLLVEGRLRSSRGRVFLQVQRIYPLKKQNKERNEEDGLGSSYDIDGNL